MTISLVCVNEKIFQVLRTEKRQREITRYKALTTALGYSVFITQALPKIDFTLQAA